MSKLTRLHGVSTGKMIAFLSFLGFGIAGVGMLIQDWLKIPNFPWAGIMTMVVAGIWGTAGFVIALRREVPVPGGYERYLRGWGAVILGGLVVLWGWGIALVSLFALVKFLVMGASE